MTSANPPEPERRERRTAPDASAIELSYPFRGRWKVENSPANRIPSHGTTLFGVSHAIDFVAVDDSGRSAPRTWASVFSPEPPELFVGFGADVIAPVDGRVVEIHDAEPDHRARRSPFTLATYMAGQGRRAAAGANGLAGNRVVLSLGEAGPYVVVAHLRHGSVCVSVGQSVSTGDRLGECGNSGNSTEPHIHLQVSTSTEWERAQGVPLTFVHASGERGVPRNGEIVTA